jgi:hypothetical protein
MRKKIENRREKTVSQRRKKKRKKGKIKEREES